MSTTTGETATASPRTMGLRRFERLEPDLRPARRKPLEPAGGGPGPHSHADFQETFYVIDGEIEVKSEASTYIAKKGSYVVIPKGGIVHSFKNKTDTLAHLLCTVVPSGLEEMFIAIGKPVSPGSFLPPPPMDPQSIEKLIKVAEQYGQKVYPPDFLG